MTYQVACNGAALCLAAICLSFGATAQDADSGAYVRNLVPEIRDLVSTATNMKGQASGLSGAAQQVVAESGDITVRETDESVILSVTSDVLFGFDSATLSGKAKSTLSNVVKVLDSVPESVVRVIGHTDSKGSDSYNQDLSKARADAVVDFLSSNGVASSRLKSESRGESEPMAPNEIDGQDNPDGRARNRRVEFVLPKV